MQTPLGQKLKAAREQRGLSLLDASHATRIPVQRLHLLEQDNFAGFGSMTYARAFLRVYSQFLGVNAHEMLEDLPEGVFSPTATATGSCRANKE
jgi:cytoskeletal protein RodZ